MRTDDLLKKLGYTQSPNFLQGHDLARAPDFGHIFRRAKEKASGLRAKEESCGLQGVYALRDPRAAGKPPIVPVVYVCRAASPAVADKIHRLVWNQDVVPFILVHTRDDVRLYSGFRCQEGSNDSTRGLLLLRAFNDIGKIVDGFHAEAIDTGRLWKEWGPQVTPETRVEWKLLDNLQRLDRWLQRDGGLGREASHALIGKYVYLHYLRDRGILEAWFAKWNIAEREVFGRCAKRAKLEELIGRLDDWLNGAVFPIDLYGRNAPSQEHVTWVASVFAGDDVFDDGGRQLHFDFARYNFKYIPIETLSVIYEQFLHAPDADDKPVKGDSKTTSRGREAGAYYTPLPVVNLMLAEMEDRLPLKRGMRILDPACGSGAFLVQCYRRLIEKEFPAGRNRRYALPELRKLLEDHIFGVDRDPDACSVTELSLTLTLLDYVHPPDLNGDERRKLPLLRDRNIFRADFFDDESPCAHVLKKQRFDWIVGNPPWKKLNPIKLNDEDSPAWLWMSSPENQKNRPVGSNQVARAFAWRVVDCLVPYGEIALLLPAMSLFEKAARGFRAAFFKRLKVHAVANFANLTEVLFAGRSRVPAAAFFYRHRTPSEEVIAIERMHAVPEHITCYSPLVANQETTRPVHENTRAETWSLVVNANEIRQIPLAYVLRGSGLPWKLATWGSHLDAKLLAKLGRRYPTLKKLEDDELVVVSEGLQLRRQRVQDDEEEQEEVEYVKEVIGKRTVDPKLLKKLRDVFTFPPDSIREVDPALCYARKGRSKLPLSVCQPPHVIVSAARLFAVFLNEHLIVPPRQIGIISPSKDIAFLKALSLFLSSDFAFYHQFLTCTQYGIKRDVATLDALRQLPVPLHALTRAELRNWTELHSQLVQIPPRRMRTKPDGQMELADAGDGDESEPSAELIRELNNLTNDTLGLDSRERALVHDLKHVRLELNDGKTGQPAVRPPEPKEMRAYAKLLRSELDAFIGNESPRRHSVGVVYDELSAMICVNLTKDAIGARKIMVEHADNDGAKQLERTRRRLRQEVSQWVYFDRNLRLYEGTRTYLFKPMQRFHWTESQAMCDAGEIIAETLAGSGGDS